MQDLIEKIKELFSSISDKVQELYEENRRLFFIIIGLVLVILICLILLAVSGGNKKNKKNTEVPGQKLELTEPLIIPDGPELPREYNASRKTKDKWTEEEAEPWFTIPEEKEIEALADSNDLMIKEIIGAAP